MTCWLYAVAIVPSGSDVVVMVRGGVEIVIDSCCETLAGVPAESVTVTVNDAVPAGPVGMPAIMPVDASIFKPGGSAPFVMVNV